MHKLDRSSVTDPACLADYVYPKQNWDDFGRSPCKRQVRLTLFQMQGIAGITSEEAGEYGLRCAYCESQIWHEGHIEHFRRKNPAHRPDLTFNWNNLFLACGASDHCGHYKDRKGAPTYNADDLIKPDEHDPDDYLYFNSTGKVRPRHKIAADKEYRAQETIRVFGLDNSTLTGARKKAIKRYKDEKEEMDLMEILSWDEELRKEYILSEIETTRWDPHATVIKHYLLSLSDV